MSDDGVGAGHAVGHTGTNEHQGSRPLEGAGATEEGGHDDREVCGGEEEAVVPEIHVEVEPEADDSVGASFDGPGDDAEPEYLGEGNGALHGAQTRHQ